MCVACFQEACTNAMHFYSEKLVEAHNQDADALLTFAATITATLSGCIAERAKSLPQFVATAVIFISGSN